MVPTCQTNKQQVCCENLKSGTRVHVTFMSSGIWHHICCLHLQGLNSWNITLPALLKPWIQEGASSPKISATTAVLISPWPDREGNKLQRQKILMFIYPIYNHNWWNISTIYIYNKTSIKQNILNIKKIHLEAGWAKDSGIYQSTRCCRYLCNVGTDLPNAQYHITEDTTSTATAMRTAYLTHQHYCYCHSRSKRSSKAQNPTWPQQHFMKSERYSASYTRVIMSKFRPVGTTVYNLSMSEGPRESSDNNSTKWWL
jgi:hypothetical protein